jgi:hypothetical protein
MNIQHDSVPQFSFRCEAGGRTRIQSMLLVVLAVLGIAAAVVGYRYYQAWRVFAVEDNIDGTFRPVVEALYLFAREHGAPATNLVQLVPRYISEIPSSRFAEPPEYRVLEEGVWQFSVRSTALRRPRI